MLIQKRPAGHVMKLQESMNVLIASKLTSKQSSQIKQPAAKLHQYRDSTEVS